MGFKPMHSAWHPNPAKRLAPGNCVRLVTVLGGKGIRDMGAPPDKAVNLFLDVDKRLLHGSASISRPVSTRKRSPSSEERGWVRQHQ